MTTKSSTTVGFFEVKAANNQYVNSEGNDTESDDRERTVPKLR